MKAWDVYEPNNAEPIDTVFSDNTSTAWEVRRSLTHHDGLPDHIWIVCDETKEDSRTAD